MSTDSAAQTDNIPIPDTSVPTTTTVATDAPPIESPTTAEQAASDTDNTAGDLIFKSVPKPADYDGNAFFNPFAPTPTDTNIEESSSRNMDPSNLHIHITFQLINGS